KGNYVQRALDHVRNIRGALGLTATQSAEFAADPHYQETSSGAIAVHLQQQYKGIPIFQANEAVRFAPDGALKETAGSSVTITQDLPVSVNLSVMEAVQKAVEYIAAPTPGAETQTDQFGEPMPSPTIDLSGFTPKVIAAFANKPEHPTVLEAGPFGDEIKANLIWFPLEDTLKLAWEVILTMPNYEGQYRTIVDANDGEILYCRQLVKTVTARGNVFRVDGNGPRQMTEFPLPLATYGLPITNDLPQGFPDTWVAVDSTIGNNVNAHLGVSGRTLRGASLNGVIEFNPADATGDDQKILNIFFYNCFMHDFFYLLRFR